MTDTHWQIGTEVLTWIPSWSVCIRSATLQGVLQGERCMSRFSRHCRTIEYLWSDVLQGLAPDLPSQHSFWGTSSYCWLLLSTYVHLQSSLTQPCTLCSHKIIGTFNLVPIKCTNILMFCPYSSMPWLVHDHFCIPTCAKCIYIIVAVCHPYTSKWQFESLLWLLKFHAPLFTLYKGSWWPQESLHNPCTVTCNNTCLPQTHNTRLCWALAYKCWSKVCHVHVVLSTLYQEKMVTEQEMEELKHRCWNRLVHIQCTKPPDVVKRTAELLAEGGHNEEGKQLKGQWGCSVYCCFSLVMCYLQWTIGISRIYIL